MDRNRPFVRSLDSHKDNKLFCPHPDHLSHGTYLNVGRKLISDKVFELGRAITKELLVSKESRPTRSGFLEALGTNEDGRHRLDARFQKPIETMMAVSDHPPVLVFNELNKRTA